MIIYNLHYAVSLYAFIADFPTLESTYIRTLMINLFTMNLFLYVKYFLINFV